jgi:predicted O-methyltransferase YrrM
LSDEDEKSPLTKTEECPVNPSHVYAVKRAISTCAPALFDAIRYSRQAMHKRRNVRLQTALTPWKQSFISKFDFVVQGGPFAGMKFHRSSVADAYLPLLIGSYEAETHGFIETALARAPKIIVDVGCEAGYVAVGLALRAPAATVFAFDIDAVARSKCRSLAGINRVEDQVIVEGECTPQKLDALCCDRVLVFCDCEGYELELLDPEKAPRLKNADIIVELHDFMRTDVAITPAILARFADTHDIAVTGVKRRSAADFPCLSVLPGKVRARALHEDRVEYQQWAYLKAKSR